MTWRSRCWFAAVLVSSGCCHPVQEHVDAVLCELASRPLDLAPTTPAGVSSRPADSWVTTALWAPEPADQLPLPRRVAERLKVPQEVPGADTPPIEIPPLEGLTPEQRAQVLSRLFPSLPPLGSNYQPAPGPQGEPLTLAELQRLALTNSPVIRQAAAEVEAARGAALQAGLYPNPSLGYEADTIGTGPSPGYQGAFLQQVIKTGGKLKLAQAAATMDVRNLQLAFRKAQAELAAEVRRGYFAVLVAQENMRISEALARFMEEAYRVEVELVLGAQAPPYEPFQLRVLAVQARAQLVQARNRYMSAWKQLAATIGLPALPPTQLAGRVDMPIPRYDYDQVLARVLTRHTDVAAAENTILKARYNLRLAQITPVPDVDLRVMVQKDFTTPPFLVVNSVVVGFPLPVWDTNKGNIIQAQGQLLRAVEEGDRVRNELTAQAAAAYERYSNNRILLEYYRDYILPDQVRAYKGALARHEVEPQKVGFAELVVAQQTLANSVMAYIAVLGELWQAVVDLSNLLQTNDLFQIGLEPIETDPVPPVPELDQLPPLPCQHRCSHLQDPKLKGADGRWPAAAPPKPGVVPPPSSTPSDPRK
ncbi:MAG: TolC family protein [Gemmataceae bacterium]|nr:TolC family protein [Gemmataceae bacterium]MDW8265554.1 TolC family protein [Gemmataceae bacterium]